MAGQCSPSTTGQPQAANTATKRSVSADCEQHWSAQLNSVQHHQQKGDIHSDSKAATSSAYQDILTIPVKYDTSLCSSYRNTAVQSIAAKAYAHVSRAHLSEHLEAGYLSSNLGSGQTEITQTHCPLCALFASRPGTNTEPCSLWTKTWPSRFTLGRPGGVLPKLIKDFSQAITDSPSSKQSWPHFNCHGCWFHTYALFLFQFFPT